MSAANIFSRIVKFWSAQPLTRRFLAASAAVFLAGMAIIGTWMAGRIEAGVVHNTATSTALYFESFIAPLVQDLANGDELPATQQAVLDKLIADTALGRRVISFKIWRKGGTIVYATNRELIGKRFPPTPKLRQSWSGGVAASLDSLDEEENADERSRGMPLLEIYAPIRKIHTDRIIAVAEFYESAEQLKSDIFKAQLESWLIVVVIAGCTIAALFGFVGRASRTIERQITELRALLAQNEELRERVERSSQRALEVNERYLRRLGAELHDGPAQLIGLALLRLDALAGRPSPVRSGNGKDEKVIPEDGEMIRTALRDALNEIRNISVGLSLPVLDRLSMSETLQAAVRDHTRRTNTAVHADIAPFAAGAIHPVKTAAFRFVQEALNNATRHAGALGQRVRARQINGFVVIEVTDQGGGFDPAAQMREDKLGVAGMRERIESLGGTFSIQSSPEGGTSLQARLPVSSKEALDHV
jgi:signal transduction histidine kinase